MSIWYHSVDYVAVSKYQQYVGDLVFHLNLSFKL